MSKLAVVLAGGGTRGAYQVGVWKALKELGIKYDIVTGTSIGSLNGALMVQDDYDLTLKLWQEISQDFVIKIDDDKYEMAKQSKASDTIELIRHIIDNGGADITPLEENLNKLIDEDKIRNSDIDFGIVTVEFFGLKPIQITKSEIPEGKLTDYLLASSACFPAFKARDIDGSKYIDGGYYDNLPINLAVKMGADEIIAVDLNSIGFKRKVRNKEKKIKYISSYWDLGNFLSFNKDLVNRNMILGYNDTMKAFGKLDGDIYTFTKGSLKRNTEHLHDNMKNIIKKLDTNKNVMLKSFTLRRLIKEVKRFSGENHITYDILISTLAQIAGKGMELPPDVIYNIENYNILLEEKLYQYLDSLEVPLIDEVKKVKSAKACVDYVKEFGKEHICVLFYRMIIGFLQGNVKRRYIRIISLVAPTEFASAVYLVALTYNNYF